MKSLSRRRFLRASAATALPIALPLGAGLSVLGVNPAMAQSNDYRALVCLFLYGGNDGNNSVIPLSQQAYQRYADIRQNLAISRNEIVALDGEVGVHPSLSKLKPIYEANRLAIVNNVGPLARPMTQAQYFEWRGYSDSNQVPENLFSHHDQQIMWENAVSTVSLRTGWGGRMMETLNNGQQVFSFNSNSRFGAGMHTQEMVIPTPGKQLGLEGFGQRNNEFSNARLAALQTLIQSPENNLLHEMMAKSQQQAFSISNQLGPLLAQAPRNGADTDNPDISAAFNGLSGDNDNYLSRQLYQVAKMIKNRAAVGGNRHIYFVTLGGFDTHSNQLGQHASLLAQLGDAMASFDQAMQSLGTAQAVTLFTESDFGRTLKPNSSAGTDHGWGNIHFVMGGGVNGGTSYGDYPSLELGGPDEAGKYPWEFQGRWIPQFSVDQYASTLAGWLAPEARASFSTVLPNLNRFSTQDIGFMGNPVA